MSSEFKKSLEWLGVECDAFDDFEEELEEVGCCSSSLAPRRIELSPRSEAPKAFDYQEDLAGQILTSINDGRRGLLSLPTGAGKTRTALLAFLARIGEQPNARWIWIAPTLELLGQAEQTVTALWRSSRSAPPVTIAFRGSQPQDANLWFTTPQAINAVDPNRIQGFEVVVFDEAHQLGAPTFQAAVGVCEQQGALLIGLSATPGRADVGGTEGLVDLFDGRLLTSGLLGKTPVEELQRRGVLSRLQFKAIGDYERSWQPDERLRGLGWLARRLAHRGRKALVFAPSVAQGRALDVLLRSEGVPSAFVDGQTSDSRRARALEEFAGGQVTVLVNNRLLATGYDCPAVSDVVIGMKVGSPILFEQMVGRAARGPLTGGSAVSRVWQFDEHLAIHGLPSSYYRYSLYDWSL